MPALVPKDNTIEIKKDAPVKVRDTTNSPWIVRHYAGVVEGQQSAYEGGKTSYTTTETIPWKYIKRL